MTDRTELRIPEPAHGLDGEGREGMPKEFSMTDKTVSPASGAEPATASASVAGTALADAPTAAIAADGSSVSAAASAPASGGAAPAFDGAAAPASDGAEASADSAAAAAPAAGGGAKASLADIEEAMKDVVDPELGINVVDLGLVYDTFVDDDNVVTLDMTLTSAACPLTDVIEDQTRQALTTGPGGGLASDIRINWVWLPPWGPDKITDDGREQLRALGFNV